MDEIPFLAVQWEAACSDLALTPETAPYDELLRAYGQPHRKYHTTQHLRECFESYAMFPAGASAPATRMALWFHDAIYDRSPGNEERSANLAEEVLGRLGARQVDRNAARRLILATQHRHVPQEEDERILVDIDLSILGAPQSRYQEYEQQIRAEYNWVPTILFKRKRREILEGFLQRPSIYNTDLCRGLLEERARSNLGWSIGRL